jgi:hypothetical protein
MNLEVQVIPCRMSTEPWSSTNAGLVARRRRCPLDRLRIVQFSPRAPRATVTFGAGLTAAIPGSSLGELIVSDIEAAHWSSAAADEAIRAHAAYTAALDREETAAHVYASLVERVSERLETGG